MIKFNFFYANFTLDAPKALCYLSNKYYFAAVKFYHIGGRRRFEMMNIFVR